MTKNIEEAITFRSEVEHKEFTKDMERMFKGMALSGKLYNPELDDLRDLGVNDSGNAKILKAAFLNMSRGKQMSSGTAAIKARDAQMEWLDDMMKNKQEILANMMSVYGGLGYDDHITRNEYDKSKYTVNKGSGLGGGAEYLS